MNELLFKGFTSSVADVDDKSRRVKVVLSETGSLDLDNEVIGDNAYTKTLSERGPNAANLIWHLTDHSPRMSSAIGKFSELYMEGKQLIGVSTLPETTLGNDMLVLYQRGDINQHSIGFSITKSEIMNKGKDDQYKMITELKLYEGSAVLWGANPNTPTLTVGKAWNGKEIADELQFLMEGKENSEFIKDLSEFSKLQIKQFIRQLTQAAPNREALEPNLKQMFIDQLVLLNLKLF